MLLCFSASSLKPILCFSASPLNPARSPAGLCFSASLLLQSHVVPSLFRSRVLPASDRRTSPGERSVVQELSRIGATGGRLTPQHRTPQSKQDITPAREFFQTELFHCGGGVVVGILREQRAHTIAPHMITCSSFCLGVE